MRGRANLGTEFAADPPVFSECHQTLLITFSIDIGYVCWIFPCGLFLFVDWNSRARFASTKLYGNYFKGYLKSYSLGSAVCLDKSSCNSSKMINCAVWAIWLSNFVSLWDSNLFKAHSSLHCELYLNGIWIGTKNLEEPTIWPLEKFSMCSLAVRFAYFDCALLRI